MCDSHDIEYVDFIWLVVSTSLKIMNVSWDYYSQYTESHKSHVPNHQPVMELCWKVLKYLEKTNISGNLLSPAGTCGKKPPPCIHPHNWLGFF